MAKETARIVVGVDGSDESRRALRWAVDEARLRHADLHVVHAFTEPFMAPHGPSIPSLVRGAQTFAGRPERVLEASLAGVLNGEISVRSEVVAGPAAPALVAAAQDAELLVVGSRGRGGFTGLLLGSVGQQCVAHAPCPVVVVRADGTGREPASRTGPAAATQDFRP